MLHAKFEDNQTSVSEEYMGVVAILAMWPVISVNFHSAFP